MMDKHSYLPRDARDTRTTYTRGMALRSTLKLAAIDMMAGPGDTLVRSYRLHYGNHDTGRTVLEEAQECAADGACKPPTRFSFTTSAPGFAKHKTGLRAPYSDRASPMLLDVDGDGLDDLLVPDLTDIGVTPSGSGFAATVGAAATLATRWNIAPNGGPSQSTVFAAPTFAKETDGYLYDPLPLDPRQLQPELGTAIDYDQDGRTDVFFHDVSGIWDNWHVLLARHGHQLIARDTGVRRPQALIAMGATAALSPTLAAPNGSVHLADLDGDGVPDLIQCNNGTPTTAGSTDFQWELHRWTKAAAGWELAGTPIHALYGYPCNTSLYTVDIDSDGKVDLVLQGVDFDNGFHIANRHNTYDALTREESGAWTRTDTKLPVSGGRLLFLDVNGDGLPDAIEPSDDAQLHTFINTGDGFAAGHDSLASPVVGGAAAYLNLAQSIDYDGDGRRDLLLPLLMAGTTAAPSWMVLRSTGDVQGPTFEIVDPKIPFEAQLNDTSITIADPHGPRVGDINGDGAQDVLIVLSGKYTVYESRAADQDLLSWVADGMNEHEPTDPAFVPDVAVHYEHLVDRTITDGAHGTEIEPYTYDAQHDPANTCAYPRRCVVGPMRVTASYAMNNGAGGARSFHVRYRDGRYHRLGRGFLGFGARLVVDEQSGAVTEELYDNVTSFDLPHVRDVYPFLGRVLHERRWSPALPSEPDPHRIDLVFADETMGTVNTWGDATYFAAATKHRSRRMQGTLSASRSAAQYAHDVEAHGGATVNTDSTTTVLSLDGFGNVLSQETKVVGVDLVSQVTRTFKNDTGSWLIGLLKTARECSASAGETSCRISELSHDAYGQVKLSTQRSDPDSYETWLRTSFDRDAFGNITHLAARAGSPVVWSPNQGELRESCTSYEPEGIFPFAHKNAAGHLGFARFDPATGAMLSAVDPNGLVTRWAHDGFGRVAFEQRPDGTTTERTLTRATVGGAYRLRVETSNLGGQDQIAEYDGHGRAVRTIWYGPQTNQPVCTIWGCLPIGPSRLMQRVVFDELGEVARRSLPASEGTSESKLLDDRYSHDAMGRLIAHTTPWGATTTFEHAGMKTTVHPPSGPPSVVQHDALGRTTSVVDPLKGTTGYTYGPFSLLREVTMPDKTAIATRYDGWGRVSQTEDPDRGTTTVHRNGFGDITSTADALSRTVTFFHDALGRTIERDDQENGVTTRTTWSWDVAPLGTGGAKAIGMLAGVASPDGAKLYGYDDKGRIQTSKLVVGGEMFRARFDYEAQLGRLATITYPSPSLDAQPFVVGHDYDAYGHLVAVRDAMAPASTPPYWKLSEVDAAGRVHQESFGNGVVTTRGYLDDKQRVQSIRTMLGAGAIQDLSYEYDDKLNLTHRHDELQPTQKDERFLYDELDRLTCAYFSAQAQVSPTCAASYAYDAAGNLNSKSDVGPDVFTYGDPITKAHPHAVTRAGGQSYGYDAAGNQTTRPGGVTVTYTGFDLPKTITRPKGNVDLAYDGDQQRIQKSVSNGDVTLYFGALYQRVTHADGSQEHRYHVFAGGRAVAIVTNGGSTPGTRYVHADHLGSVDVLTDEAGGVAERKSFDAFGARRDPQWGKAGAPPASQTTMGFTGHEDEDDLGLVNMKGRIYDPKLGRFLTPDPLVSVPVAGQSWNPYSYVLNKPLAYTDPSGFEGWTVKDGGSTIVFNDDPLEGDRKVGLPKSESGAGAGLQLQNAKAEAQKPGEQKPAEQEKVADTSQSQAALAGRVSNDTNTTSSSSGQDAAQPSRARDSLTAAKAFAVELVGPSVKTLVENPIDPAAGLGPVEKMALAAIFLAKANAPAAQALKRGDLEGAAAQAQLPVTTPLLQLIQAADDGLDSWNAGCPSPEKIGSTWGKIGRAGVGIASDIAMIAVAVGGAYGGVRGAWRGQGGEVHHMPSWNAQQMAGNSPFTHRNAPGIMMDVADHRQTASWGSGPDARAYRAGQAQALRDGRFLDVLARDIEDVQRIAPGRYDVAIREMVNHLWSGDL